MDKNRRKSYSMNSIHLKMKKEDLITSIFLTCFFEFIKSAISLYNPIHDTIKRKIN